MRYHTNMYIRMMYDAFKQEHKYIAEDCAVKLGILPSAAEYVYQEVAANANSTVQDFLQAMDTAFFSKFHADELAAEKAEKERAEVGWGACAGKVKSGGNHVVLSGRRRI